MPLYFVIIWVNPDGSSESGKLLTPAEAITEVEDLKHALPFIQDGGSLVIRRATQEEVDDAAQLWAEQHYGPLADKFAENH